MGFWLSNSGRPYNNILFTVHKLIALAAVIFIVSLFYGLLKNMDIQSIIIILIAIAALSIIALFVTGALLSIESAQYVLLNTVHIMATILTVLTTTISLYLILNKG